jgi:hypothetical protein
MARGISCGSPYHVGDRWIPSRLGGFERRIEFRRLTDQGRERVIFDRIVCRNCLLAEAEDRRTSGPDTASLFGQP